MFGESEGSQFAGKPSATTSQMEKALKNNKTDRKT
jgi:hypothetical protein